MKIEKAMEELSKLKHYVDCQPSEFNENTWDAIEEAETALQEKQEREKGCRYCNDASFRQRGFYIDDDHQGKIMGINHYCINCGRKLGESDE